MQISSNFASQKMQRDSMHDQVVSFKKRHVFGLVNSPCKGKRLHDNRVFGKTIGIYPQVGHEYSFGDLGSECVSTIQYGFFCGPPANHTRLL